MGGRNFKLTQSLRYICAYIDFTLFIIFNNLIKFLTLFPIFSIYLYTYLATVTEKSPNFQIILSSGLKLKFHFSNHTFRKDKYKLGGTEKSATVEFYFCLNGQEVKYLVFFTHGETLPNNIIITFSH